MKLEDFIKLKKSDKELIAASSHLIYEMNMLNHACARILTIDSPGNDKNAYIETFVLHMRVLIHFFYPDVGNCCEDDVSAYHYFIDSAGWDTIRPSPPQFIQELKDINKRANYQMAHLSYKRTGISANQKEWHHVQISKCLNKIFTLFRNNVDRGLVDTELYGVRIVEYIEIK